MRLFVILTQAVLLLYASPFGWSAKLDKVRFLCYALTAVYGLLFAGKLKLRGPRWLDLVAGSVLVLAFYSQSYSLNPGLTLFRFWGNVLLYLAVFWGMWVCCRNPLETTRFVQAFLAVWFLYYFANSIFLFTHPMDVFTLHHQDLAPGGYARFTGITTNPNGIGDFSAIILPLALWNFRRKKNFFNLFLLSAVIFSFFFSYSRNAFICGVIGTSLYIYLSTKRNRHLLLVGTILSIILMVLYADSLVSLLPKALVRQESLEMLGGRSEAWEAALELIKKKPLLGYGFGVEELLFDYYTFRFQHHSGTYAHNSFLGLALQLGWGAAFLVYSAFLIFFVRSFFKILRLKSESESMRTLTIALYASALSALWTTIFESWIYAAGGIIAFTFYSCLMFLMRMLEFQKSPPRASYVRHRG